MARTAHLLFKVFCIEYTAIVYYSLADNFVVCTFSKVVLVLLDILKILDVCCLLDAHKHSLSNTLTEKSIPGRNLEILGTLK